LARNRAIVVTLDGERRALRVLDGRD